MSGEMGRVAMYLRVSLVSAGFLLDPVGSRRFGNDLLGYLARYCCTHRHSQARN